MGNRVANKLAVVFGGGQTPGLTIGNGRATSVVLATVHWADGETSQVNVENLEVQPGNPPLRRP